jgi:hypothetical protein
MLKGHLGSKMIRTFADRVGLAHAGLTHFGLASLLACGVLAGTAAQAAEPQINAQELALVDRALEFCGPVDADSVKKLKERLAEITKTASADVVAQARASDTYKQSYATMDSFIGQIDPRNAKVACTNTADSK